jgi:hypothetical protein
MDKRVAKYQYGITILYYIAICRYSLFVVVVYRQWNS